MAEQPHEAKKAGGHGEEGHGEGHEPQPFDALHHILDYPVFGISKDGKFVPYPVDSHTGEPIEGYEPMTIGGPDGMKLEFTRYMQDLTVVAALVAAVIILVARRVTHNVKYNEATKGPLANAVEAMVLFVRDEIVKPIGGSHLVPYTPLILTYFFFIAACNYSGMVPWAFNGATASISVTAALGGSVLVILLLLGMIHQGPLKFFVNLVPHGVPWWLWFPMLILELVGPLIKCFVLCVRLFANMIAGHLILGNVLNLGVFGLGSTGLAVMGLAIGVPLALGMSLLEILVCILQAYVFTVLATMFIGGAIHPDH